MSGVQARHPGATITPGADAGPPPPAGPGCVVLTFTEADLVAGVYNAVHNLGQAFVLFQVYDNAGLALQPDDATIVDANTLAIRLTSFEPLPGTWYVSIMGCNEGPPPPGEWTLTSLGASAIAAYALAADPTTGRLVMVGTNGAKYSDDGGATWNACVGAAGIWYHVARGPSGFMAVGTSAAMFSADGITWTQTALVGEFGGVCWAPVVNRWIAIGITATIHQTTAWSDDDGATWNVVSATGQAITYGVTADATGRCVSLGYSDSPPDYDQCDGIRTVDGGDTWQDLIAVLAGVNNYSTGQCWIASIDRWLTGSAPFDEPLSYSDANGDAPWTPIGPTYNQLYRIEAAPSTAAWTGTDGVRVTEDGGVTHITPVNDTPALWFGVCWSPFHSAYFLSSNDAAGTCARVALE